MPSEIIVHSTTKRFIQVVGVALLMAAAMVGLKKLAQRESDSALESHATIEPEAGAETRVSAVEDRTDNIIVGRSSIIDGDTLVIHGKRIRLEGVDAPESRQRCGDGGTEWACGQQAAMALSEWVADRPVSCHSQGTDRYQRVLARCFVGNEDMQAWLVSNGWAMAYRRYSKDYVAAEEHAAATRAGMWRGEFMPPWEWRQQRR